MDVVLPKNSLTMTEAEIIEWHVPEGGEVRAGEPLFTMETEKSQVVMEATVSGTLESVLASPGDVVAAGEVIARVSGGREAVAVRDFSTDVTRSVAPAAAELATQLGLDITQIRGSGSGGRVIEEDVLKAVATRAAPTASREPSFSPQVPRSSPVVQSRKRATGNRSTEWAAAVPTFQVSSLVPLPTAPRRDKARPSDLLMAATAAALRQVPIANAFVADGEIHTYDDVRVGLLVRDEDALVPLVFPDPDRVSLTQLHERRRQMMQRVGTASLPQDAMSWPTFVISNIGRSSVQWFTAVLFPGTSATLAIGGIGATAPGCVEAVLTCDHRVLDGIDGASFLEALTTSLRSLTTESEVAP